jgi:hypothetical protein
MKRYLVVLLLGVSLFSTGCGSGGSSTTDPATYTIGGTVAGLTGAGLVLQDNAGNNLTVSANAKTFTFATAITSGSAYKVTVLTQPSSPAQSCAVTSGSGMASANVTTVSVACTMTTYTIGGTVSGLTGTGLVLQDNAGNNLTVSAGATTFSFTTALDAGASYAVTVLTQPSSPTQTCVVTNGSGTANANVTNVGVACTTMYTIGGTISNLVGTGLVLQNNGLNNLTVSAGAASFTFTTLVASGSGYNVTVLSQPSVPTQNCVVTGGTGTANANVTTVSIACTTITYSVGGTISGLVGTGLVLEDNGGNSLPVSANATTFTFTGAGAGTGYNVTVSTQPSTPVQNCVVANGSGTSSVNVTNVSVTCTTTMYTIGGTVAGLTGAGLVLQDNGGNNLTVPANETSFTFATQLDSIQNYNVTVLTQPSTPTQNCTVSGGTGTAGPDLTIGVTCVNIGEWTWEDGPNVDNQLGVYGSMGTASTSNVPGARYSGVSWSDTSGNFWLFGGLVYLSPTNAADFNDLWEGNFDSSGQWQWNWVGGDDVAGEGGTYGTMGTAAPGNLPGARDSAVSWTDKNGNFWVFGGHGYDVNRMADNLNDLWEYNTTGATKGQWTWVSGLDQVDQTGNYGTTIGTGTTSTVPGARYSAVSWIDKSGNFWLFGGYGYDSTGAVGYLNDLWEGNYNSSNQWIWTWMGGSSTEGVKGTYGSKGMSNPLNIPGARYLSTSWTDTQGNLWLFGGYGLDSVGDTAVLSDLWEYSASTTTPQWTWVGGPETAAIQGVYGTLGTSAASNIPGSRKGAVAWSDSTGNFWLFGGVGLDSVDAAGELNDLWQYNPTLGDWTWESGSEVVNQPGNWGSLGVAATTNVPGARGVSASWIDSTGNLWLFGGNGPESGVNGSFSDLWKFVP